MSTPLVQIPLLILLLVIYLALCRVSFLVAWQQRVLQRDGVRGQGVCIGHIHPQSGVCAVFEYLDNSGACHKLIGPVETRSTVKEGDVRDLVYGRRNPGTAELWPVATASIRNHILGGIAGTVLIGLVAYAAAGGGL